VHWAREDVELEPVRPPAASGLSGSDLVRALDDEVGAWNAAVAGCDVPRLRVGALRAYGAATDDGHNLVVVKVGSWCPDGPGDPDDCYDPTRQAKTSLRLRHDTGPRDGEIRETDVEINAVHFRWSLDGDAPSTRSLHAVIAHELGHVLGLDHACRASQPSPDGRGGGGCDPRDASRSIMYVDPTETGRPAVLAPTGDAIRALCARP
jgi:hypothetical protein